MEPGEYLPRPARIRKSLGANNWDLLIAGKVVRFGPITGRGKLGI
jgi:hypothetical protein